ncbi:hypothetical protein K3722_14940 [Leisingera caerulea]|uniref:DUF2946 domain-containing protein n=1 Tax=Leisingera caerulea TaxID=506591 RepID=A0ABY5WU96_LEICA|nr:hypothetical protein [Leisingera caerulea]UWQ57789.1 hypothetical protein K3722_14940 [Leisingera caerulea]
MAFLAHIFRLIRVAAAFAVILSLGFALPSAAHSLAGHHGSAVVSHSGGSDADAAISGAAHDVSHTSAQDGPVAPWNAADTGNCCAGACMAVAVISLQPDATIVQQPIRWVMASAQLPSQDQVKVLRPPRT